MRTTSAGSHTQRARSPSIDEKKVAGCIRVMPPAFRSARIPEFLCVAAAARETKNVEESRATHNAGRVVWQMEGDSQNSSIRVTRV